MQKRNHYRSSHRGRSFGRRRSAGGNRRQKGREQKIDVAKFVNKAEPVEVAEDYIPEHSFSDFEVAERLKINIEKKGYKTPTPIQDKTIQHILNGSDIVGIANTGTGKTGAFLVPLVNKVALDPTQNVLIVVPTRELAIQIDEELKGFTPQLNMFSACCVGGVPIGKQIRELKHRNNFIIGTPGRLKDLIERKFIDLSSFNTVVLDEADRMLDMGFIDDMRFLMSRMPEERHTLFFSATLSPEIERLIGEFLKDPERVSVKTRDTAKNVDQDVVRIKNGSSKIDVLYDLLVQSNFKKVLIFGKTKHGVEKLSRALAQRGLKAESIHGNKTHSQRQRALKLFKSDQIQALVATDVAARGLDIAGVTHVINYDIPATHDDYIHRIGRTGRAGEYGTALTFIE